MPHPDPKPTSSNPHDACRPYFLLAGLLLGALLSAWYLLALGQQAAAHPGMTVDPWFTRAFHVLLIFVASLFQCSLLARLCAWVLGKVAGK